MSPPGLPEYAKGLAPTPTPTPTDVERELADVAAEGFHNQRGRRYVWSLLDATEKAAWVASIRALLHVPRARFLVRRELDRIEAELAAPPPEKPDTLLSYTLGAIMRRLDALEKAKPPAAADPDILKRLEALEKVMFP